jgi:hypothetical protein
LEDVAELMGHLRCDFSHDGQAFAGVVIRAHDPRGYHLKLNDFAGVLPGAWSRTPEACKF